jgi:addiction module HigA family antidote
MESLRSKKRKPTHPGAILREDVLPELGINQTALAQRLGLSRQMISEILREQRPVTPDIAIRLARLLGGTAKSWLNMQQTLDLWELESSHRRNYAPIRRIPLQQLSKAN